ncbi:adenosylcobinamide-phosphate synthase CbiB [Halegenticoccus tardaugens]|uniref:adenosylcobinamide-phosphate synthase CbiB n=1 Tax=Halegenticoccus tardaugens TaxID=2071624 RepID=UPI00100BFA28|nr:adenosylcobinamide-phosphate synthase CbiB [Halegenticoccus tardaugens]
MPLTAAAAVGLAAGLDRLFAEPPARIHPVVWFGRLVAPADREWRRPRIVAVAAAALLPLLAGGVAGGVVLAATGVHPAAGALAAGLVLFSTTSLRMLLDAAREATALSEADLDAARRSLRALAGRDASSLSAGEVRSAATESAAENLADGLVAPLAAFALVAPLSLPLAAAAAAWVKGVNTLDSMLGYRRKPVGWASARLDDFVMWLPARLSAALIALAAAGGRPSAALDLLRRGARWAREPPSPNSGWPMATLAAALSVELAKPGVYALNPSAGAPSAAEAARGVRVVGRAGILAYALAGVVAWL